LDFSGSVFGIHTFRREYLQDAGGLVRITDVVDKAHASIEATTDRKLLEDKPSIADNLSHIEAAFDVAIGKSLSQSLLDIALLPVAEVVKRLPATGNHVSDVVQSRIMVGIIRHSHEILSTDEVVHGQPIFASPMPRLAP
jgi:hypothetical protein